jgi:hypothetical protein
MTSVLSRALAAVRVCMGLNDPSENRLHPSHGWLLPPSADARGGGVGGGSPLSAVGKSPPRPLAPTSALSTVEQSSAADKRQ